MSLSLLFLFFLGLGAGVVQDTRGKSWGCGNMAGVTIISAYGDGGDSRVRVR